MTLESLLLAISLNGLTSLLPAVGFGSIIGSIIGYEYRRYRERQIEQKDAVQTWFTESQDIVSQGFYSIYRVGLRQDVNYENVIENLDVLSERLIVKARRPPDGVPPEAVNQIHGLAQVYAKATSIAEVSTQKEGIELIAELFEMAQMEFSSEIDFAQVMQEAGSVSEGFDRLLQASNQNGVSTGEFADAIEHMFSEWDSEDFVYVLSMMASGEQDLDATVQQSMKLFLEIASNLSEQTNEILKYQEQQI